jgi:hypothetical protein
MALDRPPVALDDDNPTGAALLYGSHGSNGPIQLVRGPCQFWRRAAGGFAGPTIDPGTRRTPGGSSIEDLGTCACRALCRPLRLALLRGGRGAEHGVSAASHRSRRNRYTDAWLGARAVGWRDASMAGLCPAWSGWGPCRLGRLALGRRSIILVTDVVAIGQQANFGTEPGGA